ncbi:hypothetical protein EDD80_10773 [Anseongella ginsenosidimutans]|uniref:Uncharacterized protein n=1 Tax=Anseongella ginsenosidimutans TaxID=496056 RepID=A0A4R3KPG2_9SPHI|nr:hypothetical protein [Anseongella ginsenosidimutans]TCS86540.1 hypothetical protein EDD80_10773 [Anseongella ginsenosidimutans]
MKKIPPGEGAADRGSPDRSWRAGVAGLLGNHYESKSTGKPSEEIKK